MNKDETLRLALDTLKEVREETFRLLKNGERLYSEDKVWSTIISIQEALETKDEPVAWMSEDEHTVYTSKQVDGCFQHDHIPLYTTPQRTWVGLTELDCVGWFGYDTGLRLWFETNKGDDGAIPLYKDQQQRTWVGLTDEEIQECLQGLPTQTIDVYARRIEAKLKELNT